jgi:Peptidase family M23
MQKWALLIGTFAAMGVSQDISHDLPYVSADIRTAPVAVRTEGGYLLAYEMFVANWYDKNITITGIEISVGGSRVVLEGKALDNAYAHSIPQKGRLAPRQSTMLVLAPFVNEAPAVLDHRIRFRVDGERSDQEIHYPNTPVGKNLLRIHPPLRGDLWVATEGPASKNHHTDGALPFEGRFRVPQRFAIDFVRLYEDREMVHGDPRDVHSYRCYGAEALAVADSRVVVVRDDIPENPGKAQTNALPDTIETLGGNLVILDLGNDRFAAYAHLQPGSIRVKRGDRVQAGDVLGLVGNSASPYPHLHFQVMDGPSMLLADGMPYVFDSFLHEGKRVLDELPLNGCQLAFDYEPKK